MGRPRPPKINLSLKKNPSKPCLVHFKVKRVMIFHLADSNFLKGGQSCWEARGQAALSSLLCPAPGPPLPNAIPASRAVLLRAHFAETTTSKQQPDLPPSCLRKPNCQIVAGQDNNDNNNKLSGFPGGSGGAMAGGEGSLRPPPDKEPSVSLARCQAGKVGRVRWVAV